MIGPQAWPPLCGAVAGCGALVAVAGAAKLVRSVRDIGGDTAVQKALRLDGRSWRIFQAVAGAAELAVGLLVCAGVRPVLADTLMACQGAVFVGMLSYLIHKRVPGDCGCVARRRPMSPERHGVTRWSMARAVIVGLAGLIGAVAGVHPAFALHGIDAALAWAVALVVLALLVVIDLELHTPRCRRALWFPTRTALAEVTGHAVYQAMAASLAVRADRVLFRRDGCVDEFWFPSRVSGPDDARYLAVRAGRAPTGMLALRAAVAEHAPSGRVRTLAIRPGPAANRPNRPESQPSGRPARLQR